MTCTIPPERTDKTHVGSTSQMTSTRKTSAVSSTASICVAGLIGLLIRECTFRQFAHNKHPREPINRINGTVLMKRLLDLPNDLHHRFGGYLYITPASPAVYFLYPRWGRAMRIIGSNPLRFNNGLNTSVTTSFC